MKIIVNFILCAALMPFLLLVIARIRFFEWLYGYSVNETIDYKP